MYISTVIFWTFTDPPNVSIDTVLNLLSPSNQSLCWCNMCIRYLLRFVDCLAHPNLGATFATDEKWPICHLHISYQGLAGSLPSLKKSEFIKLIISYSHYFWRQNWVLCHKMIGKNIHIYFFYFWFKNKRVWAEKIGKKRKNSKNLKVAGNDPNI